ncbi:MAG TPA: toll/interleukin-1 receptor domain-containing protein, partial [Ktedonobacteraceae bacterium]|nr:toll/interleukin-1 receptor domain-containing protein [Ktedonobacteraceae bacterium]
MAMAPSQPLKLVYCYAPRDGALRDQLDRHLAALRRANLIETWYDGKIVPGTTRQTEINNRLHTADIILLLVSADFINSDYCYSVEMSQSLKRHHDKEALVIPILLRPAQWAMTPLRELQMIPTNVVPVTGWRNRDASWVDVTQYIQRAVEYLLFGGSCDRLYTPSQATPDQNGMWDRAEREHLMRTRAIE